MAKREDLRRVRATAIARVQPAATADQISSGAMSSWASAKTSVRLPPLMRDALEDYRIWQIERDREQGQGLTDAIRIYIVEFYRARLKLRGPRICSRLSIRLAARGTSQRFG